MDVEYEVQVRAVNAGGGPGPWSEPGRATPTDAKEGEMRLGNPNLYGETQSDCYDSDARGCAPVEAGMFPGR